MTNGPDLVPGQADLDALWRKHAAAIPGLLDRRPNFRFDPVYYGFRQSRIDQNPASLAQHFDSYGRAEGLFPTIYAQMHAQDTKIDRVLADLVIDPDLAAAIAAGVPDACLLACELIQLGEPVDSKVSDFSLTAYLRSQPDIAKASMDPLLHYLLFGAAEGRTTLSVLRKAHHRGRNAYSPDRPTCLIAVHEFSRTGAPIVGLEIVREAAQTHNVIVLSHRGGELLDDFREFACDLVVTHQPLHDFPFLAGEAFSKIDFAIINSVACYLFVPFLVAQDIPFAAYLHEYADYTFPVNDASFPALFTDLLVFSSEHVRDSWAGRLKDIEFDMSRDTMILPQRDFKVGGVDSNTLTTARERISALIGRDCTNVRLVCGAGHLQWRKGFDIFAMAAQSCLPRDPDTIFLWIGDGLSHEDVNFGAWISYHLRQIGANGPGSNFFLLPAGPYYPAVLEASDAMFLSSRLDPLPNVVFDALERGCRIVQFAGASGFGDARYRGSDLLVTVEYANAEAAATALLDIPRKTPLAENQLDTPRVPLFARIHEGLITRLQAQRYFVRGASDIDVPVMFTSEDKDLDLRIREREKMLRYRRRRVWRDVAEAEDAIARSENWVHRNLRIVPYEAANLDLLPTFSMHIHAFYIDDLANDLGNYAAFQRAHRIVVTTDTEEKAKLIHSLMAAKDLAAEVVLTPNRGRDILPFMELFHAGNAAGEDEIWCHLHQKKSLITSKGGDVWRGGEAWRRFLLRINLGDENVISNALQCIGQDGVGLVAPFDPNHVPWNASRRLLPKFASRLPGPMPDNPLLFPVGNMFWVRRKVVLAMNAVFGPDYPWPNEPIANDGTEFHLIERLWPAMTTHCGLDSVFVHKLDQKRV